MALPPLETLRIFSIDHGAHDLEPVARKCGADPRRIGAFKTLAVKAVAKVADGRSGFGMFLDGETGREALVRAGDHPLWVARQFPHDRPETLVLNPSEWPVTQVVKVIANARSDARTPLAQRLPELERVAAMTAAQGRELLVEALPAEGTDTRSLLQALYARGLMPDWWLVEAQPHPAAWRALCATVAGADPDCRGFIVIVRDAAEAGQDFEVASGLPLVRAFVGGRTLFRDTFEAWLLNTIDDTGAIDRLAERFSAVVEAWNARAGGRQ